MSCRRIARCSRTSATRPFPLSSAQSSIYTYPAQASTGDIPQLLYVYTPSDSRDAASVAARCFTATPSLSLVDRCVADRSDSSGSFEKTTIFPCRTSCKKQRNTNQYLRATPTNSRATGQQVTRDNNLGKTEVVGEARHTKCPRATKLNIVHTYIYCKELGPRQKAARGIFEPCRG